MVVGRSDRGKTNCSKICHLCGFDKYFSFAQRHRTLLPMCLSDILLQAQAPPSVNRSQVMLHWSSNEFVITDAKTSHCIAQHPGATLQYYPDPSDTSTFLLVVQVNFK